MTRHDRLHHVAVTVDDIARAVSWYRQRFGCGISYQDETWALLDFDNFKLALVLPQQHPPHLAVCRPDAESFGALHEHRDGTRSTYTRDPWGNCIEVLDSASVEAAEATAGG